MIFAGFPPTIAYGGTSLVTTAPAATIAPSPISIGPTNRALFPIHTKSRITIFFFITVKSYGIAPPQIVIMVISNHHTLYSRMKIITDCNTTSSLNVHSIKVTIIADSGITIKMARIINCEVNSTLKDLPFSPISPVISLGS